MNKNKKTFLALEIVLLLMAIFFVSKIFNQNEPEKRVAVVLSESGDKRWDSMIKGMKQAAKIKGVHLIICNTDEIGNAEAEKEAINEQRNNNIDAFIIWPAASSDTKKMLKEETKDVPVILIGEELYGETKEQDTAFSTVGPDYYNIGVRIGKQLKNKNQKVGIVAGWEESQASAEAIRGLSDILEEKESQISWCCYREKEQDICMRVSEQEHVDSMVILDPGALDEIGEQAEDGQYCGAKIYGIGSSVKSIALQDYGRIEGLVALDGYEIGYKSVEEISVKLKHKYYKMKNYKTGEKEFTSEVQFLDEDVERFLYSYE